MNIIMGVICLAIAIGCFVVLFNRIKERKRAMAELQYAEYEEFMRKQQEEAASAVDVEEVETVDEDKAE